MKKSDASQKQISGLIDSIPSSWPLALERNSKIFIPDENRRDLVENIFQAKPFERLLLLEQASQTAPKLVSSRLILLPNAGISSLDSIGLFSEMSATHALLSAAYRSNKTRCQCQTISGDKVTCTFDSSSSKLTMPAVQTQTLLEISCSIKK